MRRMVRNGWNGCKPALRSTEREDERVLWSKSDVRHCVSTPRSFKSSHMPPPPWLTMFYLIAGAVAVVAIGVLLTGINLARDIRRPLALQLIWIATGVLTALAIVVALVLMNT
jgi:hypothetical protein